MLKSYIHVKEFLRRRAPQAKSMFLETASSAGSKIGNDFLSSKGLGFGNRGRPKLVKDLC
jgi:hypothetical protein